MSYITKILVKSLFLCYNKKHFWGDTMKNNEKDIIDTLYKKYSFIENDISKFKKIALESISTIDEETIKIAEKNIIRFIVEKIKTKNFIELFEETVKKLGVEKTFAFYDLIIGEADIEIPIENLIMIGSNDKYRYFYKEKLEKKEKISNSLLSSVIDTYKSLDEEDNIYDNVNIVSDNIVHDYMTSLKGDDYRVLTREEEIELLTKYRKTKDEEYKKEFINHNLRLVVKMVTSYMHKNDELKIEFMDLIQEGNMGLLKAFDEFDMSLGYKFSTYATCWIKQKIIRAIQNQNDTIRIPTHQNEKIIKKNKFIVRYRNEHTRFPSEKEVMEYLGIGPEEYKRLLEAERIKSPTSIDLTIEKEDTITGRASSLSAFLVDENETPIDESVVSEVFREELLEFMDENLNEREKKVICGRYGFNEYNEEMTLKQIGDEFGVTRERIRQIEEKAMAKLQKKSKQIDPEKKNYTVVSRDDLLDKLAENNMEHITIVQYKRRSDNSTFKCLKCNKTFSEPPLVLLKRGICPNCEEKAKQFFKILNN